MKDKDLDKILDEQDNCCLYCDEEIDNKDIISIISLTVGDTNLITVITHTACYKLFPKKVIQLAAIHYGFKDV